MSYNISVERLRNGSYIVRPENTCGTCGWHPFPWTASIQKNKNQALRNFIRNHEKYSPFFNFV